MLIVNSMRGLGDNIYQRAFVKALAGPVYIDTPWPELYRDLSHVHFVRPDTKLRTQAKNIAKQAAWQMKPRHGSVLTIRYGSEGIMQGMRAAFRVRPQAFDLPDFGPSPVRGKYVVVRPVTVRAEWRADTRNPLPEYIDIAALTAAARGYTVVSVADLEDGKEWLIGDNPFADIRYHRGELDVTQLMALIQGAAAVIGGIGWIVPACIATKVPAWVVCGGQGGFNAPELICPEGTTVTFSVPDNFCRCKLKEHNCDKGITDYATDFAEWADQHLTVV